jgi:DNA-binding CsgD family transcriptional regulator
MRRDEIKSLVESASNPAFATDAAGVIVAWNSAAGSLFGIAAEKAAGQFCGSVVQGSDECGLVCSENCTVLQALQGRQPIGNFDLRVKSAHGSKWCNFSSLKADVNGSAMPYIIHVITPVEFRKRLEMVIRDFVVSNTGLPVEQALAMITAPRSTPCQTRLSPREIEVLRLLAQGGTTRSIADQLHISNMTVSNHIQHILRKLDAHTRLEAIRRAEHARLI